MEMKSILNVYDTHVSAASSNYITFTINICILKQKKRNVNGDKWERGEGVAKCRIELKREEMWRERETE